MHYKNVSMYQWSASTVREFSERSDEGHKLVHNRPSPSPDTNRTHPYKSHMRCPAGCNTVCLPAAVSLAGHDINSTRYNARYDIDTDWKAMPGSSLICCDTCDRVGGSTVLQVQINRDARRCCDTGHMRRPAEWPPLYRVFSNTGWSAERRTCS